MSHRLIHRVVLGVTTAVLIIGVGLTPAAATPAARTHAPPTIVLVHGAWADSTAWNGEVTRLRADGYPVRVFPTPLRGLRTDAAYLRGFLSTIAGPVVLVGHSYGGAVVTNAATGLRQVRALVYVDGFAPAAGETVQALATARPGSVLAGDPAGVFDVAPPYAGAPDGDVDLYVKPAVFEASFANDLTPARAAAAAAAQRPVTASAVNEASGRPAWISIPSWYVLGGLDLVIPPAEQRFLAKRAHAEITVVPASHLSLLSRPGPVTRVIEAAAASTAG